jgi:hypothetical protein
MITKPSGYWSGKDDEDGNPIWVDAPEEKYNPYRSKVRNWGVRAQKAMAARRVMWQRKPPNDKGYTWRMGYNNLVGMYTQGSLFPTISGSSLNRKKNAKDLSGRAADIIAMVAKTEVQCGLSGTGMVQEWEGGRAEHVSTIVAAVGSLIDNEDIRGAGQLAMRFSEQVRKQLRTLSYGIHVLSTRSRGKIKDKATAFFRSCPGSRVFGTFTFISAVDDRTGMSILNKFLTQARKKFPGLQYFWVAERQENRNIHFHMILNKRLPIGRWNALWVVQQYNAGLVGKDKFGDVIPKAKVIEQYLLDQKEGFRNKRIQKLFNPLDIKKVSSIQRLSYYLTKYITKQEKNKPFGCAVWHCSRRVSRLFTRQVVAPSAFAYMKSFSNYGVDRSTGELWGVPQEYKTEGGFAVVIMALNKAAPLRYMKMLEQTNKWVLEGFEIDCLPEITDEDYFQHYICKN